MSSSSSSFYELLLFIIFLALSSCCHGLSTFRLDLHHRFSEPIKRWAAERSAVHGFRPEDWPEKGSVAYYTALADLDRFVLRSRVLAKEEDDSVLSFSEGNATFLISNLGFLHYTTVSLGTPSQMFLVALDTGSDLFWVPCDCVRCASTSSATYGFSQNLELNIYSPNTSTTSQKVPCASHFCEAQRDCSGDANVCPYKVTYVSTDTSSNGVLVEDVIYLTTEGSRREVIDARIIFGCGQTQSGKFLDFAAPNGLFGLGMDKISVPSILSAAGLAKDSFSMCFGSDGVGTIVFGDKGSPDQDVTPFDLRQSRPTYNISVTGLRVGASIIGGTFSALFDTGTSFTYLADPAYTLLSDSDNISCHLRFHPCDLYQETYWMSGLNHHTAIDNPNESTNVIPIIALTMKGGGQFSVSEPTIAFSTQGEDVYCLAIVKSHNFNIIGQNFMTGQRMVFDREKLALGWKKFDCYGMEDSSSLPINRRNATAASPSIAVEPHNYTPEATKQTTNESSVSVPPVPTTRSCSFHFDSWFLFTHLMPFLLLAAIL